MLHPSHEERMSQHRMWHGGYRTRLPSLWCASALVGMLCGLTSSGCLDRPASLRATSSGEWNCALEIRPNDTEIRLLPKIVSSHRILGTVKPLMTEEWLTENQPIFEVWSPDDPRTRLRSRVGLDGRIVPMDLQPGRYCFRASAVGFGSVVGRIWIVRSVSDALLDVRLPRSH